MRVASCRLGEWPGDVGGEQLSWADGDDWNERGASQRHVFDLLARVALAHQPRNRRLEQRTIKTGGEPVVGFVEA